jgi:hypothetical protein
MSRKNALRALKNLCTFIGAIVLFSYFYNWTVDARHWYVTLASAFMCSVLWLGFYMIEVHRERIVPLLSAFLATHFSAHSDPEPEETAAPI